MTQDHNSKTAAPDDAGLDNDGFDNDGLDIDGPALDGLGLADFLPDTSNGYIAKAGAPLENPAGQADPVAVEDALKSVHDPEIPVNIYDLGLIYTIDISAENMVKIIMTLTAPGCPVAGDMPGWIQDAVAPVAGVQNVEVELTWDPPWGMDMMSDEARLELGFM